jgi:hypothetical protein
MITPMAKRTTYAAPASAPQRAIPALERLDSIVLK